MQFNIFKKKIQISITCRHKHIGIFDRFEDGILCITKQCQDCHRILDSYILYNCPDPNNLSHKHTGDCL